MGEKMSDKLFELFSEVLEIPVEELNENTSPENTPQWDSLAAMMLIAAIENEFDVQLTTKEILKMSNIGAARALLKEKNADI